MSTRITQLEQDIRDLKNWCESHEDAHTADTNLLASIVASLQAHNTNHHGWATAIKKNGGISAVLVTVGLVAIEVIRRVMES